MEILYLLVPVSVGLVFAIGAAFWWSVRSGQFDDLDGPAYRILMDDDRVQDLPGTQGTSAAGEAPRGESPGVAEGQKVADKDASV